MPANVETPGTDTRIVGVNGHFSIGEALAKVDPRLFGIALVTTDGQVFNSIRDGGHARERWEEPRHQETGPEA